jgi:UrcA family protein
MKLISNSGRDHLMFTAVGAFLCGFVSASSPAVAQAPVVLQGPSSEANEQVIIQAPYVVRREPLPRAGAPTGFRNPELISLSRGASYADLDLSRPSGAAELETRVRNTAKEVCQELNRQYPRTGGQYVYANTDCVKKATDDGLQVMRQVIAVASR